MERELTIGDVTAATICQAALGTPGRVMPVNPDELQIVNNGETFFNEVGCTECHVAEIKLDSRIFVEPNPLNPAGTAFHLRWGIRWSLQSPVFSLQSPLFSLHSSVSSLQSMSYRSRITECV